MGWREGECEHSRETLEIENINDRALQRINLIYEIEEVKFDPKFPS